LENLIRRKGEIGWQGKAMIGINEKDIIKVGMSKYGPENETLYPQVVVFVIWEKEGNKRVYKKLAVQGLQNVWADMVHFNPGGEIEVIVMENETIIFEFSPNTTPEGYGWVSASVKPGRGQ